MLIAAYSLVGLLLLVGLWLAFGPNPRRRRAFARAQKVLKDGDWERALRDFAAMGRLSGNWEQRVRRAIADCHEAGATAALKEQRFEDALAQLNQAATVRQDAANAGQPRIVDAMLGETRRLFSLGESPEHTTAVLTLLHRIEAIQPECPEASFWRGLCQLRQGQLDDALGTLNAAHERGNRQSIDPPLYLGMVLLRQGKATEALRVLSEANRVDSGCPLVTCQTGISLVAAGGDCGMAVRTLQRGLGPKGLALWARHPDRAWIEAFPENKSFVRKLAAEHRYRCPLLGADLVLLSRQARTALAQAHYRLGAFAEAAELFQDLLKECPPNALLLRGQGLALARLQRFDQAYKPLRAALEMEAPKDPFTAAYLALCGAMGKPTQPTDRPKNVAWALRLLTRHSVLGSAEWATIATAIHAEARGLGMAVSAEDQLLLCDALASVDAVDRVAGETYSLLAKTRVEAIRPEHAWLFAKSASGIQAAVAGNLGLFDLAFRDRLAGQAFFKRHQWDYEEAEIAFLTCAAEQSPGRFPEVLGAEYPVRGVALLLARSEAEEKAGKLDLALKVAEGLHRLAPNLGVGLDRLARLHFQRGEFDQAASLLADWQRLQPSAILPWLRQAVLEHKRGAFALRDELFEAGMQRAKGHQRANVAFVWAKLLLQEAWPAGQVEINVPVPFSRAIEMLELCLREDPRHAEAGWCLAAVYLHRGDKAGLTGLAITLDRSEADCRTHYLAGVCHLAAGDYARAAEAARHAGSDPQLAGDSAYLLGMALLKQGNEGQARAALEQACKNESCSSAAHGSLILGRMAFLEGKNAEACRRWSAVGSAERAGWHLDEPLRQVALLAGLEALGEGRFEQAAEQFREASRLGLRDRRLAGLIAYSHIKAGQQYLYAPVKACENGVTKAP